MTKTESDAVLADRFWGRARSGAEFDSYRTPLPTTKKFRRVRWPERSRSPLAGLSVPPYLLAVRHGKDIQVLPCFGSACQAHTSGIATDPERDSGGEWLYIDSETLPKEWRKPIESALADIRRIWPHKKLCVRPRTMNSEAVYV